MAKKKSEQTIKALNAQITALKQQNTQLQGSQKNADALLTRKNAELTAAIEAAQKKSEQTTKALNAQITALKQQNTHLQGSQKNADALLARKNAELTAAAEAAQKKLEQTTSDLTAQIVALKQQNAQPQSSSIKKKLTLNKTNLSETLSYSLGAFYLQQIMMESKKLESDGFDVSEKYLMSGFNDAFNKKSELSIEEIEENISSIHNSISKNKDKNESALMKKIGKMKYEKIQDGVYLVIEKKGKGKYARGEVVKFNTYEKRLDGTPIMNTMNASVRYDHKTSSLVKKVIESGLKKGEVTIYAQASFIYNNLPDKTKGYEIISVTFVLL